MKSKYIIHYKIVRMHTLKNLKYSKKHRSYSSFPWPTKLQIAYNVHEHLEEKNILVDNVRTFLNFFSLNNFTLFVSECVCASFFFFFSPIKNFQKFFKLTSEARCKTSTFLLFLDATLVCRSFTRFPAVPDSPPLSAARKQEEEYQIM